MTSVTATITDPTTDPCAAVAAYGLPGSLLTLPAGPLDATAWAPFLLGVRAHRLVGHLAAAVADGALRVTDEQRRQVRDLRLITVASTLRLEHQLILLTDVLTAAGIEHRVLDGPALARLAYPTKERRPFVDLEVLVPTARWDETMATLLGSGYQRRRPALREDFDRRFGTGVTLVATNGVEVDLHRTFVMGPFGLAMDPDLLFAASEGFDLAGRHLQTLDRAGLLFHACYAASVGDRPARLDSLRDVAQLLLQSPDVIETERILDMARRCRATVLVARAVTTTWRRLQLADAVPLSAWASRHEASQEDLRWLAAYHRSSATLARTAVIAIPRFSDRLAYLRAMLLPSASFLDAQGHGKIRWIARGIKLGARDREPSR
jgi:hypothetical protein